MFKIESYITPILLSYFDKYIKNFRPQDSQLSLWGGEASFQNLDLRLEVLEQELQLPFSFVSGHIHELLIYVPWTKLASEPITVTINTIECILKLKNKESSSNSDEQLARDRHKRNIKRQDVEAPPGYIQSLINKIVSNVKVYCNNLILKYVEEDIVVSMNVKLFKLESADNNWQPAFIETSSSQVTVRKLITILDLTICLDKRNAAGKIDVYQEPVLYRCSLIMHMLRHYQFTSAKRASTTRFDIYCENMEFSMTEQQVPMLMRISMLLFALQQKQLGSVMDTSATASNVSSDTEVTEQRETWAGWAWSFVPSILPSWDDEMDHEQSASTTGHILHIGFYVDFTSLTFKVLESSSNTNLGYPQRKVKYLPLLTLRLQGLFVETISHGVQWFQSSCGVNQIVLLPLSRCCCGYNEVPDDTVPSEYLKIGKISMLHKTDSLFDDSAMENNGRSRIYNTQWDYHLETVTEDSLLERGAAFATDYIYTLDVPVEMAAEQLSEFSNNLEYSNFSEKSLIRIVFGHGKLLINNGFYHRISSLRVAASTYDYPPYATPKPDIPLSDLPPSCADDFDALSENIPTRSISVTAISPVIKIQLMNHPYFEPNIKNLYRKPKKMTSNIEPPLPNYPNFELPLITLECRKIILKVQNPMYVKRLVYTICQLPDPPVDMFNMCHTIYNLKVIGLCSRLIISPKRQTIIINPSSILFTSRNILKPQYWINPDVPHHEVTLESENITIAGTKAKFMVILHIIYGLLNLHGQDSLNKFCGSTLLRDAACNFGMSYLELCVEALRLKKVRTNSTITIDASLGSIKGFICETAVEWGIVTEENDSIITASSTTYSTTSRLASIYSSKNIHQILFICGPDKKYERTEKNSHEKITDVPLFMATVQFPLNPDHQRHPSILSFKLLETAICIDPLLCKWLSYYPKPVVRKQEGVEHQFRKNRNVSEASGSLVDTPRRMGTPHESIHSCSDKEPSSYIPVSVRPVKEADTSDFQDNVYNFLQKWFNIWKSMLLTGETAQCSIYFPVRSLSAIGAQGIQEAVAEALREDDPPDIFVITLPLATFCSASQRTGLAKYMTHMPIKLPPSLWENNKSGFPWIVSISDMNCYTLQNGNKLNFLKPLFLNITVGVSTKAETSDTRPMNFDPKGTYSGSTFRPINSGSIPVVRKPGYPEVKADYGPLGICVHVDMSSIAVCISEVQVCLLASILHGLKDVLSSLLPNTTNEMLLNPDSQSMVGWNSQISPLLVRQSSVDSLSENIVPAISLSRHVESNSVKLTAWIQWTIARFRIQILAHDRRRVVTEDVSYSFRPNLKLVFDAEDIVSSIDFQNVYLKIKNKVATASIHCFKRELGAKWVRGECLGIVMKATEDSATAEKQDDTAFATFTITSASSAHTHAMWGALHKDGSNKGLASRQEHAQLPMHSESLYITEILFTSQPIEIILSASNLKSFYVVLEPLFQLPSSQNANTDFWLLRLNNQNLPLVYVECQGIRVIMPSSELSHSEPEHNVCILQVDSINLMPSAVNPICRTPCRPDIYQMAAQIRILNVPGSEAEDRQYQLDITGLSISTGIWDEVVSALHLQESNLSTLRTMSENPALEWNNLDKNILNASKNLCLIPLVNKFDLSIVVAPAMMYRTNTLVCGHSVEVNCVTDIDIKISLNQIKLTTALSSELLEISKPFNLHNELVKRPKIIFPYQSFELPSFNMEEDYLSMEYGLDSGIDTAEFEFPAGTDITKPTNTIRSSVDSDKSFGIFPRPSNTVPPTNMYIPIDILITGGTIRLTLYEIMKMNTAMRKAKNLRQNWKTFFFREVDSESGYDASAEGSVEEQPCTAYSNAKEFSPLLFMSVCQPNVFLSRFSIGKKMHITCFDVKLKLADSDYICLKRVPEENDCHIHLLETKSGIPLPNTGIPPSFFTLKWSKGISKPATVDIELARPTRILGSVSNWKNIINIKQKVFDNISRQIESVIPSTSSLSNDDDVGSDFDTFRAPETYTKFRKYKNYFHRISHFNIKFTQIVLAMKTENVPEVNLSISKLTNNLILHSRPEKIINKIAIEDLCIGIIKSNSTRLLLNPWSLSIETCLFWETWQTVDSNPQIQVSFDTECIMIDLSPEQIQYIQLVVKELSDFFWKLHDNHPVELDLDHRSTQESYRTTSLDQEQFYKDDLRAGAFQFVDSTSLNLDELPLPYQVMFWNKPIAAMAWRYPQPRALTKIRIFPVPFKSTSENCNLSDYQVRCHIEYWSECQGCYQPYLQFYLSESEMCQLDLPESNVQSVACIWRVVLNTYIDNDKECSFESSRSLISPRALAACMRIDSYFNKVLIPDLSVVIQISAINISLNSNFNKSLSAIMPEALKQYTCDLIYPENHCFLALTLNSTKAYLATWNFEAASVDISTSMKCSVLDYAFLTQQSLIESFSFKIDFNLFNTISMHVISKPICLKFSPSIAHTLAVSLQSWDQSTKSFANPNQELQHLIIMTQYVICNDTNIKVRFGQTSTDEDIPLCSRYCHLYCWRSQKFKPLLRVGLEENGWIWSKAFQIDMESVEIIHISSEKQLNLVVTVKNLSSTQKQIIFSGQFIISNMLLEHFEMKIVPYVKEDTDNKEFKKATSYIISGKCTPPSLLIDTNQRYHLRLRFLGLESAWSGDIPLSENPKCAQPWLVKVPLQERGQFLSIWCRVMVQQHSGDTQILVILWPLYMVRSNLPGNAKVHIETPALKVRLESTAHGKGECQQLYCPGTIDHSHQLSFHFEGGSTKSNPYVPLNYSLVDQKQFFKKSENENVNDMLAILNTFDVSAWPYFGEDLSGIDWICDDQPLTHVQLFENVQENSATLVRYQNACQSSSALLVELLPWSLMINMLGTPISLLIDEKEVCRIRNHGIVTPPKIEGIFHLGVAILGSWHVSLPLQLAKSEWGKPFYKPRITGTVPTDGSVKTAIICSKNINLCMVSITSCIVNEIRLLKISSTHVITNHMDMQIHVVCFAVNELEPAMEIPSNISNYCFTIPPHLDHSNTGMSIMQWLAVGTDIDLAANFALYISVSLCLKGDWSCPIRVDKTDKGLNRRNISAFINDQCIPLILVGQEYKGQTYLSVHKDPHPQILIRNKSDCKLFFAQCAEDGSVIMDSEHFNWVCGVEKTRLCYYTMPAHAEKFPDISPSGSVEKLIIASDPQGDPRGYQWSIPISINSYNDQFVQIPFYGDVKITISNLSYTLLVIVNSASEVEISAQDIRIRLFMQENELNIDNPIPRSIDLQEEFASTSSNHFTTLPSRHTSTDELQTALSETDLTANTSSAPFELQTFSPRSTYGFQTLPTLIEHSTGNIIGDEFLSLEHSDCDMPDSVKKYFTSTRKDKKSYKLTVFVKGFTLTLLSNLNNTCTESTEIGNLVCEDIVLTAIQSEIMWITATISEMQFDNQMYSKGGFDFPVVLIGQQTKTREALQSLNTPISQWVTSAQANPILRVDITVNVHEKYGEDTTVRNIKDVKISIQPLSVYIEDIYITELIDYLSMFSPTKLVLLPKYSKLVPYPLNSSLVRVPEHISWESVVYANPLSMQSISIEPVSLLLSLHSSLKLYIALHQSPLQFGRFERTHVITTSYRLGHALTMHYLSGAIFGAGWVVGSLELLGSPGGLARAMGTGLHDFISLPYRGFVEGPWAFLRGITHGSASLMKHVTAGTLQSVTKLASSVARNLDRMTLDEEHLRRTEEQRRQRPQGVTQGFLQGLTGLGISLLGAVGGIAHHPIQSVMTEGASPRGLATGVGLGLVGIITKPLSGAADLVALTGQGLLQGAGWNPLPEPRYKPFLYHMYTNSNSFLKYNWKFLQSVAQSNLLFMTEATWITNSNKYEGVTLVLTTDALIIVNIEEDTTCRILNLQELYESEASLDPTLLSFKLQQVVITPRTENEHTIVMDPACRARVVDFVRNSVGLLQLTDDLSLETSEVSIAQPIADSTFEDPTVLTFYVNPQTKNYFNHLLQLAKQQHQNYNFPVI